MLYRAAEDQLEIEFMDSLRSVDIREVESDVETCYEELTDDEQGDFSCLSQILSNNTYHGGEHVAVDYIDNTNELVNLGGNSLLGGDSILER